MIRFLCRRLSYANVMSTLAVFIALGGSAYAVNRINGSQLKNRSVSGKKLKRNTLGGSVVRESRLGTVPFARRASNAARIGGLPAARLVLRCPAGTEPQAGVCVEFSFRQAAPYGSAQVECESVGRRLPHYHELTGLIDSFRVPFASGGELVSEVYPTGSPDVSALVVTSRGGQVTTTPNTFAGQKQFRCAAYPSNG